MEAGSNEELRIEQLCAWIATGWRIDEPVLQRSAYYTLSGRVCMFEVVLRHGAERRVLTLRDSPAVSAFLAQQHVAVLDLA